ncbi:hypothetical protein QR680_004885 [Steinernema hermaphroditum]|uniref:Uncharacterized protein n=1 Tax=Steinernema hermaphroditum TaxID=289476 RepID=A0AA39HSC3_9BILA|nr:hypothetical protein QR680_004885 [Steinernema hermaphroditum]
MTESQASTSQLLEQLDKTYAAEKAKFDQWKTESIKRAGTDAYNEYVQNFQKWESDVLERRAQLISSSAASSSVADVDYQLHQILNNISPTDFVIAMFTAANKDPKFAEAVFSAVPQASAQPAVHHPYGSPAAAYPQPSVHHYPAQYSSPAVTSYGIAPVSYQQTPPTYGTNAYSTNYTPPVTVPPTAVTSAPSVAQEAWANAALKSYRPPSPVRDYRKMTQLPFSDFSQT